MVCSRYDVRGAKREKLSCESFHLEDMFIMIRSWASPNLGLSVPKVPVVGSSHMFYIIFCVIKNIWGPVRLKTGMDQITGTDLE